ncbi:hypothetical protein DPEC_G00370590, partial [Dallia pectoralis]
TKVLPDMTGRNAPHQPSGTVSWVGPPNQTQMDTADQTFVAVVAGIKLVHAEQPTNMRIQ